MSHYTKLAVAFKQEHEACLIKALQKQFPGAEIQVNDSPMDMIGYDGQNRTQARNDSAPACHIKIDRKFIGRLSNDMGYTRDENGGYTAYIDEASVNKKKQGLIAQEYGLSVSEKVLKYQGYATKRVPTENGAIRLEALKY